MTFDHVLTANNVVTSTSDARGVPDLVGWAALVGRELGEASSKFCAQEVGQSNSLMCPTVSCYIVTLCVMQSKGNLSLFSECQVHNHIVHSEPWSATTYSVHCNQGSECLGRGLAEARLEGLGWAGAKSLFKTFSWFISTTQKFAVPVYGQTFCGTLES